MSIVNYDWVAQQMTAARVTQEEGEAALRLLATWQELDFTTEDVAQSTIALFGKLAQGHAVVPEVAAADELWVDLQPGQIVVSDEVRVKPDAYTGEAGTLHNGRRGKVVGVRYGDVIFRSNDGREPLIEGAHHSPHKLEKRVR